MTYRAPLPRNATVLVTTTAEGNFADSLLGQTCVVVHQIHGNSVREVGEGETGELGDADALVSTSAHVALAVRGADCPLIGLSSEQGIIAAVHAGWKGLFDGVIEQAVATMRRFGATNITAVVGPFIGVECYEFQDGDLAPLIERFGDVAKGKTASGKTALDLDACLVVVFERLDVVRSSTLGTCTACSTEFNSWRKRKDTERHALVITRDESLLNNE